MNLYSLKKKINSIQNTGQVTKALQLIATTKQKKSKANLENSRFVSKALSSRIIEIQKNIEKSLSLDELPVYFKQNSSNKILFIVIMSHRGLCGGMNAKIMYDLLKFKKKLEEFYEIEFIGVNKMSHKYLNIFKEKEIIFFSNISEDPSYEEIYPLIYLVKEEYIKSNYKEIYLVYSNFIRNDIYEPKIKKILPIKIEENEHSNDKINIYTIEPNPKEVITYLSEFYIEQEIIEAILSTIASENSARMISMKKATDNIKSLSKKLILELNKTRQAKITQQVSEIIGGIST